ncbi:prephenate dehydrogenase [Streptomyces sp. NPDC021212]|uniref:prephenate dehydrogenase n=1 Tax=Streptomyces sp. NPDC021212 TaxID=3365118 RepID=UPI0037BA4DC4
MVNALSADNSVGSTIEALKAELPELEKQQEALKGDLDAVTQRLEVVSTALTSLQALSGATTLPQAANGDIAEAKPAATATDAATGTEAMPAADAAAATRTPAATRKAAIGRQRSKAKSTAGGRAAKTATKAAAKKTAAKKPAKKAAAKDTAKPTTKATTKAAKATEKSAQTSEKAATKATAKATAKPAEKSAKAAGTSSERSTGLSESVLGALKKAGRPMRASEVNEALGRDETRTNVNSVRNTLERLRTTDRAKRSGRGLYEAAATS